ncbi:hypothetical protein ASPWEDRAFT_173377 [Aspergillus wentii DTO 134E9]|uniref:Rhodopsin domain-containing protein n=1 Tax=Aspergillus wentii DTO 134E9 TaxID=1073089 RepID=A0A1L9RGG9_ASPWE|nr:uncharacterized protein ASPWEDRAFT_173377 [Aspergillus wentii DTO 134E9]OJJ33943.1 hypothetical protein ASPWEDRAFT_173377 [Aspergillus wentii DTO 134E9]
MYVFPITTTLICLTAVAVVARMISRFWYVRKAGWDDLMIVVSLMTNFVLYAFIVVQVNTGLGEPENTLSPSELRTQLKALWLTIPFYNLTLTLTKISMALLYRRLFPTTRYRIVTLAIIILITITGLWMTISAFVFCIPIAAFWDPNLGDNCLSERVVWCLNASIQITTDLVIVVLPMPVITRLRLPKRQKWALVFVFGLGFFVCAMSIVRLVTLVRLVNSTDETRSNALTALWSSIEADVAIICACLPQLRPLVTRVFPHLLQPLVRSSTYRQQREKKANFYGGFDFSTAFNPEGSHYSASVTGQEHGGQHPDGDGIQVVRELRLECSNSPTPSVIGSHTENHPERNPSSVLDTV